ncbi:unnamed protein product [Agarophyton chilense]
MVLHPSNNLLQTEDTVGKILDTLSPHKPLPSQSKKSHAAAESEEGCLVCSDKMAGKMRLSERLEFPKLLDACSGDFSSPGTQGSDGSQKLIVETHQTKAAVEEEDEQHKALRIGVEEWGIFVV